MRHWNPKLQCIACALLICAAGSVAQAQSFPSKPIRLVVPLAPGGGGDIVSRLIAQKISESNVPAKTVQELVALAKARTLLNIDAAVSLTIFQWGLSPLIALGLHAGLPAA